MAPAQRLSCPPRLPGAQETVTLPDGTTQTRSRYTPHARRATTATLLLEAGVALTAVQALLGHRPLTTTQLYDQRRRQTQESASFKLPLQGLVGRAGGPPNDALKPPRPTSRADAPG